MTSKTSSTGHWLALLLILLLAWGLRIWGLADHNIWWDEGYTTWLVRHDVGQMNHITATDTHPPLYFWGLHAWRGVVDESEFLLRFPSVVFGTLAVAAVYGLARALGGRRAGLLAALFLAVSRFAITWSQQTRMYILAALLATLALWAAVRYWQTGSRRAWLGYVLAMTAGLMTLYLYVSVLIAANLAWLIVWWRSTTRWHRFAGWAGAQVAVLALFAPWLAYAVPRIPSWSIAEEISPPFFVRLYATLLTTGVPIDIERYTLAVFLVMMVLLTGLVALWLDRRGAPRQDASTDAGAVGLLLGLLLPAAIVYTLALPIRFFYTPRLAPRYLLILSCCFYALLAWGIIALARRRRWLGWLSAGTVLVVAMVGLIDYYPSLVRSDDYVSLSMTLQALVHPDDAVVLQDDTDWPIFAAHYPDYWHGVPNSRPSDPASVEAFLAPIWAESEGVWLVKTPYARQSDPKGQMQAWLAKRSLGEATYRYADSELRFFSRTPERAATIDELKAGRTAHRALEMEVAPGLRLVGAELALHRYRLGDTLYLFLFWENDSPGHSGANDSTASTELTLVYGDDEVVKSMSVNPGSGPGRQRQQINVPLTTDLNPGRYVLRLNEKEIARFSLAGTRTGTGDAQVNIPHAFDRRFANSDGDESIQLLGYELTPQKVQPGETVALTLYWSATAPITARYKVFTHLLGDQLNPATGSVLWGQHDAEPDNFARPTTTWLPKEIIIDRHAIPVDASAPPGQYRIEIGLYDGLSGVRLGVLDTDGTPLGDHVILDSVTVP